jgi:hypothetical protein
VTSLAAVVLRLSLLAIALVSSGCLAFGTTQVGRWRAHEAIDHRLCLEDEQGSCVERREITRTYPDRAYGGAAILVPGSMGVALVEHDGDRDIGFRLEGSVEALRGRGRFAYAIRGSYLTEFSASSVTNAAPLTVLGHAAVSERLVLRGGVGYSPYTWRKYAHSSETLFTVGRALLGVDVMLLRRYEEWTIDLVLEADHLVDLASPDRYRSTGLTASFVIRL